jgi:undecaprenyl-diphosphatase
MIDNLESQLLHQLNHYLARSPAGFDQALNLIDRLPWLLAAGVLAALWFLGEPGTVPTKRAGLTQLESRGRVLLILAALAISFLCVEALQAAVFRPRPLVNAPLEIPIHPQTWQVIRNDLAWQSSFPALQPTLLLVITTGLFYFNRYAGGLALLASAYFGALQVGVGFHWPGDILAGGLVGILTTSSLLAVKPLLDRILTPLVLEFEIHPGLAYALGFLILFDLSQKFATIGSLTALVHLY